MKTNFFKKFIYLAAVQLILVSQLLVVAVALTTNPIYAESGSGSEGTVTEESTSGSNSGSSSEENTGSGTSGGDTNPTDESAGAVEQTADTTDPNLADGSNSGSGSNTEEPATVDTQSNSGTGNSGQSTEGTVSNSGTGNADTQVISEESTAGGEVTVAEGGEVGTTIDEIVEEPAPATDTVPVGVEEPVIEGETADALGDTINVAPGGTAPDGTPATILEQTAVPAAGEIDPATGFPEAYQDATGVAVVACLDGTDPNCVLPAAGEEAGFDPTQPTELGTNFPSEFFYWIAESDSLDTPNGGKTFIRTALEGAFLNEEPLAGDQMVFGRIRLTGTGLEPDSEYTVTHPYGVDTYVTDEEGIVKRGEGTEDIGCFSAPCNFAEALGSRVFENFLRWDSGAPVGYLGDAATPHTVVGSPTGQNFFRIEGPGLPFEGLFTNLFAVAGKLLSGEFTPGVPQAGGEAPAEIAPGLSEAGAVDETTGFPTSYQDALGTSVVSCLDGTDPNCVLPAAGEEAGFDPTQPTELGTNFPSEFFYWIAESDSLDTPNGGKTFIRTALEGAFLNEEPLAGDQMVFGRIRVTGTGLEPNSVYTVTHPYGVDVYTTDERGILRRNTSTEDIGCEFGPCNFAAALQSRVFEGFLQWDSGAPAGYLGDAVTPHTVTGSPTGQNFFRIEGPGLGEGGLFTNLFTVAGKLASAIGSAIGGVVDTILPADTEAAVDVVPAPDAAPEGDIAEPAIDTDLPGDIGANTPDTEVAPVTETGEIEEEPLVGDLPVETEGTDVTIEEEAVGNLDFGDLPLGNIAGAVADTGNAAPADQAVSDPETVADDNSQATGSTIQTDTSASGSSQGTSEDNSSVSNSGTSGGSSEEEQRGSVAEGEVAGVDEEQIAADGTSDDNSLVLAAFSENSTSEEAGQAETKAVNSEKQSKQVSVDPLEILLALAALAIAGGLITGSAFGNLNLKRYLDVKKVWRFR